MEIEEGVTASTDKTLQDLHNSSYDLRKPNSIIVLLFIQNIAKTGLPALMLSLSSIVYV